MIAMVLFYVMGFLGVGFLVAQVLVSLRYKLERGERGSRHEAIDKLVQDIATARESILVACDECHASDDAATITSALVDAKKRAEEEGRKLSVEFVWGPGAEMPPFVRKLETDRIIDVYHAKRPLPFTGRIIDGRTVEIHRSGSDLAPKKFLRAEHTAPGLADRLSDLAHAS
jgi:hypothetical protein